MAHELTIDEVIERLANGETSGLGKGAIMQAMAELQKRKASPGLSARVSEKSGAISVYGLQSRPVTLYGAQWERLAAFLGTGEFTTVLNDPKASKGKDDPRYAMFRAEREAAKQVAKAAKAAQ